MFLSKLYIDIISNMDFEVELSLHEGFNFTSLFFWTCFLFFVIFFQSHPSIFLLFLLSAGLLIAWLRIFRPSVSDLHLQRMTITPESIISFFSVVYKVMSLSHPFFLSLLLHALRFSVVKCLPLLGSFILL